MSLLLLLWFGLLGALLGQSAPAWSVAVDPATAGASGVDWMFSLAAPYCGGYRIGDGVSIQPEPPLAWPTSVPAEDVQFAGGPATVSLDDPTGILHVAPAPGTVSSMICTQGQRPFTVEITPAVGLSNPDPGSYTITVWTGASPTPVALPVQITSPDGSQQTS